MNKKRSFFPTVTFAAVGAHHLNGVNVSLNPVHIHLVKGEGHGDDRENYLSHPNILPRQRRSGNRSDESPTMMTFSPTPAFGVLI